MLLSIDTGYSYGNSGKFADPFVFINVNVISSSFADVIACHI